MSIKVQPFPSCVGAEVVIGFDQFLNLEWKEEFPYMYITDDSSLPAEFEND